MNEYTPKFPIFSGEPERKNREGYGALYINSFNKDEYKGFMNVHGGFTMNPKEGVQIAATTKEVQGDKNQEYTYYISNPAARLANANEQGRLTDIPVHQETQHARPDRSLLAISQAHKELYTLDSKGGLVVVNVENNETRTIERPYFPKPEEMVGSNAFETEQGLFFVSSTPDKIFVEKGEYKNNQLHSLQPFSMSLDNTDTIRHLPNYRYRTPSITPNGEYLVFFNKATQDSNPVLYSIDLRTGHMSEGAISLPDTPCVKQLAFSPDSQYAFYIAEASGQKGQRELRVVRYHLGMHKVNWLTNIEHPAKHHARNGPLLTSSRIYYLKDSNTVLFNAGTFIYAVPAQTDSRPDILINQKSTVADFAISPDERRIAVAGFEYGSTYHLFRSSQL